jgi:hypothetical protein
MKNLACLCAALLMFGLLAGCGKRDASANVEKSTVFQSAPPESKAMWDAALSASKTNDYAAAYLILRKLSAQPDLSAEQKKAAEDMSTSVNTRMTEAASKGDANALKAMQDIRQSYRSLQRPR